MFTESASRLVPDLPWTRFGAGALLLTTLALGGWEAACRARGYEPGLDDTSDLWAEARRSVRPDSTVIVGASRSLFGLDLDVLEAGLGTRPVQLALVGSSPLPVLDDLAADATFHGTVLVDLVPGLLLAPEYSPPYQNAVKAVARHRDQTLAQRCGHLLSLPLERTFAFLQQEDLTLAALLDRLPVPDRDGTQVPPALPPFFYSIDRERRARMLPSIETDAALRDRVRFGWLPLFTPPPKPRWIPDEGFGPAIEAMIEAHFAALTKSVRELTARGCRVVFVRLPSTGELRELERRLTPRQAVWDRVLRETGMPGVHFEDHDELAAFDCPEWSHLTASDSVEFTRRLVPHLRGALASGQWLSAVVRR
ncbi:MAG TPA: hypothetical protein VFZ65_14065 [Planctomycetota bacterium]|nr:hypothetical protein [Planctomycetota bacterium]